MERIFRSKWYYIIIILACVALVMWGYTSTLVSTPAETADYETFSQGWSQLVDGELVPLDDIGEFYPVEAGESLVFTCTLPEISNGEVLLFYTEHQEVWCHVDGVLIHNFTIQDEFSILKTPGTAWNQVDLTADMSGGTMVLTLSSQVESYQNHLNTIYYIEDENVDSVRVEELWFHALVAVTILILMLVAFVNGLIWKNQNRKWFFLALGEFQLFALLWALGLLNFFDLFTGRPIISFLISAVFMRLIPVALWRLAVNSTNRYDHPYVLKAFCILSLVNAAVPWLLQFAFGISVLETQWLNACISAIVGIGLLFLTTQKFAHFKELQREEYPCLAIGLIVIGRLADIVIEGEHINCLTLSSLWTVVGFIAYTVVVYLILLAIDAETHSEKIAIEQSYEQLQVTSMMQQIKAHFIFNTLNTISALCKESPAEADQAIRVFATYLRSYMFLTNQQGDIPVEQELKLVNAYLTIEKLRFGDELSFEMDTDFKDFTVPPLSVMNLVEGAVNHGVRGLAQTGEVVVTTRKVGEFAQVEIADTGMGVEPHMPSDEASVGLRNVRKYVEMGQGGSLTIESIVGKGTTAVLQVPLHHEPSPDKKSAQVRKERDAT